MKLAILFWFYKKPLICKNRLKILRKHNPKIHIYGLYGGNPAQKDIFISQLTDYLDDCYTFEYNAASYWKWCNGDLLITEWYRQCGQYLPWDSIVIVQWDMLILAPIEKLFSNLPHGQILLSGVRSIEKEAQGWEWVTAPEKRDKYLQFLSYIKKHYNYSHDPVFCIFIVVVLSRIFLEKYSKITNPELGFLEYRLPIYAQIFGIEIVTNHPFRTYLPGDKISDTVISVGRQISLKNIVKNLLIPSGARFFHPYCNYFPVNIERLPNILRNMLVWADLLSTAILQFIKRVNQIKKCCKALICNMLSKYKINMETFFKKK
ncbi:MAG: hypothetical protein KJ893_08995 [Candidatus Omnitrophica bacterium]|nr:hypothetical protein [Candidatus Omnitrophota bacterium]MBU4478289.1 hypothetical protein [Candidatus Omnitrophota bacterium]MCG2703357.1 hypothetical protein [Candidatus Omnitrophota bacterium]